MRTSRRAFTLIELLTVVAIIGILAALLLPTLNRANASARLATCRSNLRQIGLSMSLYLNDFAAYPPEGYFYINRTRFYLGWNQSLLSYCGSNTNVYLCPAGSVPFRGVGAGYRYNESGTGGLGLAGLGTPTDTPAPVPQSQVLVPAEMIAIADMDGFWGDGIGGFGWPGYPVSQHRDGRSNNAAFCDGHVETCYSDRIPTEVPRSGWPPIRFVPDAAHARRWNIDNQPHQETWPQ